MVKLIDYRKTREELKTNSSPFTLAVEAFLRYIDGRGDLKRAYEAKKHLIRTLFEKNFDKRRIEALLRFIDWTLQLPEGLERRLEEELPQTTGGTIMPYVTSWERMAAKKAKLEGKMEAAKRMLEEGLDISLIKRITGLPEEEITRLREEESSDG